MEKKKLLLSALLAVSIGTMPSVAGDTEVLSDEDLEDVSAQGVQVIRNGNQLFTIANSGYLKGSVQEQSNNLDSVQISDEAQQNANIQGLANGAVSSLSTNANFLNVSGSVSDFSSVEQTNTQDTSNHLNEATSNDDALAGNVNKQKQYVINSYQGYQDHGIVSVIKMQNNNNNSVQMRDNAQQSFVGIMVFNAAASSGNAGFNTANATGDLTDTGLTQSNTQSSKNFNNTANSVIGNAVAVNAEIKDRTNISAVQGWTDPESNEVVGDATQTVINVYGYNPSRPDPYKYSWIEDQNNNNNSVQAKGSVQQGAHIEYQANIAKTAANFGKNFLNAGNITNSNVIQENAGPGPLFKQLATNHLNNATGNTALAANVNKETQNISNMPDQLGYPGPENGKIVSQHNNNNSVQYLDDVQMDAAILVSNNAALSALNTGLNIVSADNINGSVVSQSNDQLAQNFNNTATGLTYAYAGNVENTDKPGQYIENGYATVEEQNNNNNSIQFKDNVQLNMHSLLVSNSANSAANNGINLLAKVDPFSTDIEDAYQGGINSVSNTVIQTNDQTAENHNNDAYGNIAKARNYNKESQYVKSFGAFTIGDIPSAGKTDGFAQNNNQNSVQLAGNAQGNAKIIVNVNSALSAVNTGGNAVFASKLIGNVSQSNTQTASNFNNFAVGDNAYAQNMDMNDYEATQVIDNEYADINGVMNNNNNSVQITDDAQAGLWSVQTANVANSASNFGINIAALNQELTGNTEDTNSLTANLFQVNDQTAENHDNLALGASEAYAQNLGKESQKIVNGEGLNIPSGASQNNNNNSIQLSGNAMQNAHVVLSQNAALSALNSGMNLLSMANNINTPIVIQSNYQTAKNFNNTANANIADAANRDGARGDTHYNQDIYNNGTIAGFQGNMNNSIIMTQNAQANMNFIAAINSANSAVNNGINLMAKTSIDPFVWNGAMGSINADITQTNEQYAYNHTNQATGGDEAWAVNENKQTQRVYNDAGFTLTGTQCNANNSIKLSGNAQYAATGLMLVNAANSAVNSGLNLISATSVGGSITQTNIGTASNWDNNATATGSAYAGNINW